MGPVTLLVVGQLVAPPAPAAPPASPSPSRLAADTPLTTVRGNTFIAPAGWSLAVRGAATIVSPPEPGNAIALVDVSGADADGAVAAAWAAYAPSARWPLIEFKGQTPAGVLSVLATMQPTSKFGEMYQYSNPLAAAAGYIAGHVALPDLELGAAYDAAMQREVFDPLGMKATTFDFARALAGNHATAHAPDVDGRMVRAEMAANYSIIPHRPAGAAWSSVHDLLRYVSMELAEGAGPGGQPYIGRGALLARRAPQVSCGKDRTYGMGLIVDRRHGVTIVRHGGSMIGFYSDMMWLPEHGVGAVVLTNGDPGWILPSTFRRKLLEVLFDGRGEADADRTAQGKAFFDHLRAERRLLVLPAEAATTAGLAPRYANQALGEVGVERVGKSTVLDYGEWRSEVATKKNPDGTVSLWTVAAGVSSFELLIAPPEQGKRVLVVRDAQHEYKFVER